MDADKSKNWEVKVFHLDEEESDGEELKIWDITEVTNEVESKEVWITVADGESFSKFAATTLRGASPALSYDFSNMYKYLVGVYLDNIRPCYNDWKLNRMIGQMIMTGFHGDGAGENAESFAAIENQIKRGHVGGVILFDVDVSGLVATGMSIPEAKKHIFSSNIKNSSFLIFFIKSFNFWILSHKIITSL